MSEHEFRAPRAEVRLPDAYGPDESDPNHLDLRTQPDYVEMERPPNTEVGNPPEFETPTCRLPLPPDLGGQVSREELELALERAKLVADDCSSILQPAVQAMRDGAWVSSRADEFSLALDEHARIATAAAQRPVEIIENALSERGDSGDFDIYLPTPEIPYPEVEPHVR